MAELATGVSHQPYVGFIAQVRRKVNILTDFEILHLINESLLIN